MWGARRDAAPAADEAVGPPAGAVLACALQHPQVGGKSTRKEIANPGQKRPGAVAAAALRERARRGILVDPARRRCRCLRRLGPFPPRGGRRRSSLDPECPRPGPADRRVCAGGGPAPGVVWCCPHLEDIFGASGNDVTVSGVLPGWGNRRGMQPCIRVSLLG